MTEEGLRLFLALYHVSGLTGRQLTTLLRALGSPERIRRAGPATLRAVGLGGERAAAIAAAFHPERLPWMEADRDIAWLQADADHHIVTLDCPDYPPLLRAIESPPPLLFARGSRGALQLPQVAIVGSRSCTPGGRETAASLAADLLRRGPAVTSGLALGIDAAAHRAAVNADKPTLAVLGSGLERVYPSANRELAREIEDQGLVISEMPRDTAPKAAHFPQRNRIIAGMSVATVVVEASRRSGSLITARLALEQNREVFAVPGSLYSPVSRGCHQLIREGAALLESVDDLLQTLPSHVWTPAPAAQAASSAPVESPLPLETREKAVYREIDLNPAAAEQIRQRTGLEAAELNRVLVRLELGGWIMQGRHGWLRCRHGGQGLE